MGTETNLHICVHTLDFKYKNRKIYFCLGVKFKRIGGHLNLEVQASEFNFTEGKLLQNGEKSIWISNDKSEVSAENPRYE